MALALLFGLGWVPIFVFRAEAPTRAFPHFTPGERVFVALTPLVVTLHVTLGCLLTTLANPVPRWRAALSAAVFVASLAFWLRARVQIGPLRTTRLPDEPPRELRQDGPFGLVRNPLTLGVLVASTAPVIATARPILVATLVAAAVFLVIRTFQEEARLRDQVGEAWFAYAARVKRLIPWVW